MNSQQSLEDQLNVLYNLANKNGLYDAADWVKNTRESQKAHWVQSKQTINFPEDITEKQLITLKALAEGKIVCYDEGGDEVEWVLTQAEEAEVNNNPGYFVNILWDRVQLTPETKDWFDGLADRYSERVNNVQV
jgi:hypothetical protein